MLKTVSRLFVAVFAVMMLVLPVSKSLASEAAAKDETVKGKIVAAKTDDAKKVTAVDFVTADKKVYHLAGDKAKDLFADVDKEMSVTGKVSEGADKSLTLTVEKSEAVKAEKTSG